MWVKRSASLLFVLLIMCALVVMSVMADMASVDIDGSMNTVTTDEDSSSSASASSSSNPGRRAGGKSSREERDKELEAMAETIRSDDPYKVLGVSRTATQDEIRKAYRRLSKQFHPDKHEGSDVAAKIFKEIGAAYDLLGDPDKRAVFDDFGKDQMQGFRSHWEYMQSNKASTRDFYTGNKLITSLSEKIWERRVTGDSFWAVNFYAPWCTHCQQITGAWASAASTLEGEVEFACVNGVKEPNLLQRFNIYEYPTIMVFAPKYGISKVLPNGYQRNYETFVNWIRRTTQDIKWLAENSAAVTLTPKNFNRRVLQSDDFWLVLFTPGMNCRECGDAKEIMMRYSNELRGLAKVGHVSCHPPNSDYVRLCREQQMWPIDTPQVRMYRKGFEKELGEVLEFRAESTMHMVLQTVVKVLRMSTSEQEVNRNQQQQDQTSESDSA